MKTKGLFFLTTFLFFTFSLCNAQQRVTTTTDATNLNITTTENTKASSGGFEITAGANIANLSGSDADSKVGIFASLGYTSGVDGGAVGTYTINYTRGGYKFDYYGTDIKANLDYIGLHWKCLFGVTNSLYLGFGMGMNFLIGANYSYDGETEEIEDTNFMDMPIPLSVRYYIGQNKSVFLDATYNLGLFPVFGDKSFLGDYCNRGFILSLGLKL